MTIKPGVSDLISIRVLAGNFVLFVGSNARSYGAPAPQLNKWY